MRMEEKLKEGTELGKIKSVAWYMKGEDQFKPVCTKVRFEDVSGKVFELVLHDDPMFFRWKNQEEVILNYVLATHGIMPKGHWIGITDDIPSVINMCRKALPYTGVFYINEDSLGVKTGWEEPEYIF